MMNRSKTYFAENNGDWMAVPAWVDFFIHFGYSWRRSTHQGRRVALISMPCESPGAGLLALGSMISDLGNDEANDSNSHKKELFKYADQYLNHCRGCDLEKCDPELRQCGYTEKSTGIIRSIRRPNHLYFVSDKTDCRGERLFLVDKKGGNEREIAREYIFNLHADGLPPFMSTSGETGLSGAIYQDLCQDAHILPANLRCSYSGVVLAGRAKGESNTKAAYESVHFCNDTESYTLAELLAIHEWADTKVSRTGFFNVRNEVLNHAAGQPELIVADGDASFLKSIDMFKKSDVIGVIDRSLDRDRLEMIGQKVAALKCWYQTDTQVLELLPTPVPGITVAILKKS